MENIKSPGENRATVEAITFGGPFLLTISWNSSTKHPLIYFTKREIKHTTETAGVCFKLLWASYFNYSDGLLHPEFSQPNRDKNRAHKLPSHNYYESPIWTINMSCIQNWEEYVVLAVKQTILISIWICRWR